MKCLKKRAQIQLPIKKNAQMIIKHVDMLTYYVRIK